MSDSRRSPDAPAPGRLYVGTSGFAYPGWTPRFYPAGLPAGERLRYYASRFRAVELNATAYRRPSVEAVRAWVQTTPPGFRFAVRAQRGATWRALRSADPTDSLRWLVEPLPAFGDRLAAVLVRIEPGTPLEPDRLERLLSAWPAPLPLSVDLREPAWRVEPVVELVARHGAALCVTEHEEDVWPPALPASGRFVYLRLRRPDYRPDELAAWAARIRPLLDGGRDVYAFFRHDEVGRATELAAALERIVAGA